MTLCYTCFVWNISLLFFCIHSGLGIYCNNVTCEETEFLKCGRPTLLYDVCTSKTDGIAKILSTNLDLRFENRHCQQDPSSKNYGLTSSGFAMWTSHWCYGTFRLCLKLGNVRIIHDASTSATTSGSSLQNKISSPAVSQPIEGSTDEDKSSSLNEISGPALSHTTELSADEDESSTFDGNNTTDSKQGRASGKNMTNSPDMVEKHSASPQFEMWRMIIGIESLLLFLLIVTTVILIIRCKKMPRAPSRENTRPTRNIQRQPETHTYEQLMYISGNDSIYGQIS